MFDVAVVGGGPAGAAAAWTAARRGLGVVLVERGEYPRDKVCGEFFSAEGWPLLREMAPELTAEAPEIRRAVFVGRRGRQRGFALPEVAHGVSRLALDAGVWAAAGRAGAELRSHTAVTAVARDGEGFRLELSRGEAIAARRLIVAAGRWWRIDGLGAPASLPKTKPRPSAWVGVKARFLRLEMDHAVEMHLFRGGYCGLAPVEKGWTNACCLVQRGRAGELAATRDFAGWMAGVHPRLGERLRGAEQATPTVVTAPVEVGPRAGLAAGALVAGDGSGFIDPFTGDGMARALLSGRLAAEMVERPEGYAAALAAAAGPSYRASAGLRLAVSAPGWVQEVALRGLAGPRWGARLVTATRWRGL